MEGGVAVGVQLDAPAFLIERDLNPLQHPVSDDFSLEEKERLACADQLGERLVFPCALSPYKTFSFSLK